MDKAKAEKVEQILSEIWSSLESQIDEWDGAYEHGAKQCDAIAAKISKLLADSVKKLGTAGTKPAEKVHMDSMSKANCKIVHGAVNSAMEKVAAEFGLAYKPHASVFDPHGGMMRTPVEFHCKSGKSGADNYEESQFKKYASAFGLKPEWFGKTFKFASTGKYYTVCGLAVKSKKFPVIAKDSIGKRFKFQSYTLQNAFNSKGGK